MILAGRWSVTSGQRGKKLKSRGSRCALYLINPKEEVRQVRLDKQEKEGWQVGGRWDGRQDGGR